MDNAPFTRVSQPAAGTIAREGRIFSLAELCDALMASYIGRDEAIVSRLRYWRDRDRFGDRPAHEISIDDVEDALADLAAHGQRRVYMGRDPDGARRFKPSGKPMAETTLNRYLTTLGSLYKWARKRRLLPRGFVSPTRGVERNPENNARIRYLTDEERERLLAVCRVSSWSRLYMLVLMAITTGARQGELLALRWSDVDLERAVAYIATSKNDEPRVLPLTETVRIEMQRIKRREPDALVFASPRRPAQAMNPAAAWRRAVAAARIPNFRFHDLRHTCASYLAQQGASLLEIADVLGHKQLQMVRRYSHLSTASKTRLIDRVLGEIK